MLLKKILDFRGKRYFSTYLVTMFVALTTLSVIVILVALYGYFGKRVESEFRKKILAEKGQVQIILNNRLSEINRRLEDLASDNVIRVTVMLDGKSQLEERISEIYPSWDGVSFFVRKEGESLLIPKTHPNLSRDVIDFAQKRYPFGEFLLEKKTMHLLWWFTALIMDQTQFMGTAHALYDLTQDRNLIETIRRTVSGNVTVVKSGRLFSLTSGTTLPIDEEIVQKMPSDMEFLPVDDRIILSKINGFDNLYFQSSLEPLVSEKRKVKAWIGLFAVIILVTSTLVSIHLGKTMVEPLGQLTEKAMQISEGQKDLFFENGRTNFWEFNQLSQAFNYMLANLKDAEEQSRYKELLENVDDAVYILDREGKVLEANEAAYTPLGYNQKQFFELNLFDIVPQEDARQIIHKLGQGDRNQDLPKITLETYHTKANGDSFPVEIHSRAISYRGLNVILNVARDISERVKTEQEKKRLETQLIHSQKMEAVGTLAGGIAHDFNNLLMGIEGYASLMRLHMASDDPNNEFLQGIENAVTNAANLTSQLLGFARKGKYKLRPIRLNTVVTNSTKMLTRTRKETVIHQRLHDGIWTVEGDQGQIEQVLINLFLNACHAMPEGGEIFVHTENVYLSDDYCKLFEVPGGNYVKLSVTDTGVGIDKKNIEKIFDPFFTTKEVGKGTGLGLASAYGIIKNHNGIIRVYSEKNHGTTFDICLPATDGELAEEVQADCELLRGKEKILLVDDEEDTIRVEERMLRELGYMVSQARGGKEAIALYKEKMSDFALVALDMIMPEMNGKNTYEELKKINPDIKVLLVSGYSLNRQIEELMDMGCDGFIQKPFDITYLSRKIREVLDN